MVGFRRASGQVAARVVRDRQAARRTILCQSRGMETSLIGCLQAYEEAHNRHDVQAVMAMCTDDIRFEVVGV